MEGLLYRARVDTVFAGHVDAYECFVSHFVNPNPKFFIINHTTKRLIMYVILLWQNRVYNHKETNCAPVHITIGGGGNREGLADK